MHMKDRSVLVVDGASFMIVSDFFGDDCIFSFLYLCLALFTGSISFSLFSHA